MTVAISVAAQRGRQGGGLRLDRQHVRVGGRVRRAGRADAAGAGPEGKIAAGKLAQAIVHGAQVIMVRGSFDDCLRLARELAEHYPVALVNSVNPIRLEGQKTAAFEIVDALGDAPDVHVLPVGNAGNISAYWKGYREYAKAGRATRTPQMRGFQAEGAAPLVTGAPVPDPETVATAIRIGNPASWHLAVAAADESGGRFSAVTDEQILTAQRELAAHDGVFVEPASAAGVAGLLAEASRATSYAGRPVVVTVTGHGLKDIDTALCHVRPTWSTPWSTPTWTRAAAARAACDHVPRPVRSGSPCRPRAPTSAPASTRSASRSTLRDQVDGGGRGGSGRHRRGASARARRGARWTSRTWWCRVDARRLRRAGRRAPGFRLSVQQPRSRTRAASARPRPRSSPASALARGLVAGGRC